MVIYIYLVLFFCLYLTQRTHKTSMYELKVTDGNIGNLIRQCNKDDRGAIISSIVALIICAGLVALMVEFWDGNNDIFIFKPYLCGIITATSTMYCLFILITVSGYKKRNEEQLRAYLDKRKQIQEQARQRMLKEKEELASQYGPFGTSVQMGHSVHDGFYCFPESRVFYHNRRAIPYDHVIDVQVDSRQTIHTDGHAASTTQVDGAGFIGGALIGEAVAGDTGAIIGAMSAPQHTTTESHHTSRVDRRYTVTLYLRGEAENYFDIDCGKEGGKDANCIKLAVKEVIEEGRRLAQPDSQ